MPSSHIVTLTQNKEFRTLYYRGKSAAHPAMVVYTRRNRMERVRLGITTGKKLGGAVQRNRCRRVLRESFRQLLPEMRPGFDVVLVARSRLLSMKTTAALPAMRRLLRELGVIPAAVGTSVPRKGAAP